MRHFELSNWWGANMLQKFSNAWNMKGQSSILLMYYLTSCQVNFYNSFTIYCIHFPRKRIIPKAWQNLTNLLALVNISLSVFYHTAEGSLVLETNLFIVVKLFNCFGRRWTPIINAKKFKLFSAINFGRMPDWPTSTSESSQGLLLRGSGTYVGLDLTRTLRVAFMTKLW